jgi:hypothetical protein
VKINFDAIEDRLKSLVESSAQLFTGRQQENFLHQLASALESFLKDEGISDLDDLPKMLILEVSHASIDEWNAFPIAQTLQILLQDAGLTLDSLPVISVNPHEDLLFNEVRLHGRKIKGAKLDKTAAMPALSDQEPAYLNVAIPANAFLIINGLETRMINQQVFNIGRRLGNDLVIEDARISRDHAQIRAVKGKFVIFDLNSSGGTFVNSIRITQQQLFPGDVISLAGLPLVYGEDNPPPFTYTSPVESGGGSEPEGDRQ